MCDPVSAMLALTAVSTVNQANAAQKASQAAKDAADYNAAIARNNSIVAGYQAQDAINRGDKAAQEHDRKVRALAGTQRASMAARGLDISEGTPANILNDTALFGQMDHDTIKTNAAREAWGYKVQASNADASAGMYDFQSRMQDPQGAFNSTLINGAASVATKWYGAGSMGSDAAYRAQLNQGAGMMGID